jgi:transposase
MGPRPDNMINNTKLSSLDETGPEFNPGSEAIKLGIDVHQDSYVVVMPVGGSNPKPAQRFQKAAFLGWAAKLARTHPGQLHAVYEACGFGFGLPRRLARLGISCHVVCPQKLDEHNKRVKTDGRDAKVLCLKLDRYVEGNQEALALVRVPSEEEEQLRAVHRQREQLVKARKQLEAQGRSLMINHGVEPLTRWWKRRTFAALQVPAWTKVLLSHSQPILLGLEEKIRALSGQLEAAAAPHQPRGVGKMTSVIIEREIGRWERFQNRRQVGSYTGLCPGEYSSGATRYQSSITKHGNPRLRAALVELAWRLVRFQPNFKPVVKWRAILAKRGPRHRPGAQESDRGGRAATGGRLMAHPHWPDQSGNSGLHPIKESSSRGTERNLPPNETFKRNQISNPLEREACPWPNLNKRLNVLVRRPRLGRLKFLFHRDRIDQMVLRPKKNLKHG